ncbi:PREP [Lepeophtheirus salmonis]|nr:PREP [Lepeophtheirus salmonis]CAF2936903.1 PREP [Lepeophtheirus salmonis]
MDMLRFHKFTIGNLWMSDYGNPDEKDHFENNLKYSPLHNVRVPIDKNEQYPATLLTTADHDDRVVASHSLKLIAELQHVLGEIPKQKNPLMIRIETEAGHGGGTATRKEINEVADCFCFLVRALYHTFK